jgi:GNAT superfamily N-acetyltransferase
MNSTLIADSDDAVARCYDVLQDLRPDIRRASFVGEVARLHASVGYELAYRVTGEDVVAVAGYRVVDTFSRGRMLYVDDLVTAAARRSEGHGAALLAWLRNRARELGCARVDLDSGTERTDAHRFYEREGMRVTSLHFAFEA